MAGRRVTIADVAERAGVDRGLVSKVLNHKTGFSIRESTRHRILQAAADLSYRPSGAARTLRTSRTGAIGVLLPTFTNPIWPIILDAAEAEADRRGYTLLAGIAGDEPGTEARRPSRFLELAKGGAVDGLLVASTLEDADIVEGLTNTPWLHINRRPDVSRRHLLLDDAAGIALATRHLIDLDHRKLAHISGPLDTDSGRRRLQGFRTATEHLDGDFAIAEAQYDVTSGMSAMRDLLTRRTRPTGVVCANVASAAGALAAAAQAGIDVPGDISVVALHDIVLAQTFRPALTTVRMPLEELGRRAVKLLLDTDPDADIDEMIPGPVELVERDSTASPSRLSR